GGDGQLAARIPEEGWRSDAAAASGELGSPGGDLPACQRGEQAGGRLTTPAVETTCPRAAPCRPARAANQGRTGAGGSGTAGRILGRIASVPDRRCGGGGAGGVHVCPAVPARGMGVEMNAGRRPPG